MSYRDLTSEAAVRAALSEPWSNGQTEGQVHRLKLIKRQMYGRANFDLLRLRVIHTALDQTGGETESLVWVFFIKRAGEPLSCD